MEDFRDLWNQYDTGEIDKLNLEKSNICKKMFEITEGKQRDEVQLELNLVSFIFVIQQILERPNGITLDDLTEFTKQFVKNCDTTTFEYFKKRYEETKSSLNKWRYAFACWLISPKKDPIFINNTVSTLITCSEIHLRAGEYRETTQLLLSAFNLVKLYNILSFNIILSELALRIFYSVTGTANARWMLEPVEIFAMLNKSADYNLVNNMITNLHREADNVHKKNNHLLQQSFLETSIELCHLTSLETALKDKLRNEIRSMVAESLEDDADNRRKIKNSMAAVSFYKNAQTWYERAGKHEKVNELNKKIRDASGEIVYQEFKHEITLPELNLKGNNGYELVKSFCDYNENIPSLEWVTNLTKDLMKQFPISSLFPNITFNKYNPTSYANDEASILESKIKQQTIWSLKLLESRLSLAVKKLEEEKKLTESDFVTYLTDIGLYDEDQLTIIKSGIADHFRGNYIASIHTLMPQVEGTLRSLLKAKGISVLKTKREIIMDSELGSLLAKPEVTSILGEDFVNYLKVKYADPDGINLRNNVSHALSLLSDFNYETSVTLIQTIFKLAKLSVTQ